MIRKLAEELASNEGATVQGANEVLPLDEPGKPPVKPSATPDPEHGFTQHSGEGHAQTTHGVLQRSLDNFNPAAQDYERVMTQVLGEHVKRVSGSSATSQRAVRRFRERKR
jgi:hypothetical protein